MAQSGQSYGSTGRNSGGSRLQHNVSESRYNDYVLPLGSRNLSRNLGIGLVCVSLVTTIFGVAIYDLAIYNVLRFSGVDVWGGLLVSINTSPFKIEK